MLRLDSFLTAYDPSDLPGASIDPLGFDRGYTLLAEKFLPGLTNVANRPRYLSVLCAAIALSDARSASADEVPRERHTRRLDAIQRAERFWALACVLASHRDPDLDASGIRGIRYVQRALARLEDRAEASTAADYRLLSRQVAYGLVGVYGSIADTLGMIDRQALALGSDIGRRLGEAFLGETAMPDSLQRAIAAGGAVGTAALTKWGAAAHIQAAPGRAEADVLREALVANPIRARASALLAAHPSQDGEHELLRLERILKALASTDHDADLREVLRTIVAYERCYRGVVLVFQRLLSDCQTKEPYAVELSAAATDPALVAIHARLRLEVETLEAALVEGQTSHLRAGLDRLDDVRAFLHGAARANDVTELIERVLGRHADVQRSKRDGDRPKMPWLEVRNKKVVLTLSSSMQLPRAPAVLEDVPAHAYRTFPVDQFLAMATSGVEA